MTTLPAARGRRARPRVEAEAGERVEPRAEARVEPLDVPATGERVYVWDLVVRGTHWLIALSIVVLSVTGYYIGNPFVAGADAGSLTMAWFKTVHAYTAIVFSLSVVARIAWAFVSPRPYARWRQLIPVDRQRRRDLWGTFLFYTFVRLRPPPAVGHNPLAGLTYVLVFGLYLLVILTGLGLYSVGADVTSYMSWFDFLLPLFGGAQGARWLHHVIMWLLIGFTVHHVYSAWLMARVEKNGVLDSIFSGYKYVPREQEPDETGSEGAGDG